MKEALRIKEIAKIAGKQNGCRIYDIYKHRDRWQIFIDKQSKKAPISLKDCENMSHSLQFLLDSELPHVLENRRLEISSPGLEKQLREKWHFEESVGQTMKLTTTSPVQAQNKKTGAYFLFRSFTGSLASISSQELYFKNDSAECSIPFSKIKSARLLAPFPHFEKPQKPHGKKKKLKSEAHHVS